MQAKLLNEGYPVLISNRTDPFSANVWPLTRYAVQMLTEIGTKACFQTKGGTPDQVNELLDILDYKACFYVTITSDIPELAETLEPGAPPVDKRFEMIERLVKAGHYVQVGLNPCVRQWIKDPKALIKRIANAGADGVWFESLHFDVSQNKMLSQAEKTLIGLDVMAEARNKHLNKDESAFLRSIQDLLSEHGLEEFSSINNKPSKFFAPYRKCYEKTFPIIQDVVNICHKMDVETPDEHEFHTLFFDDFWSALTSERDFPNGVWKIESYLAACNRKMTIGGQLDLRRSPYKKLVKLFWCEPKISLSPCCLPPMALAVTDEGEGLVDQFDLPVYVFSSSQKFGKYAYVNKNNKYYSA
jgi:DNA repair photolyase